MDETWEETVNWDAIADGAQLNPVALTAMSDAQKSAAIRRGVELAAAAINIPGTSAPESLHRVAVATLEILDARQGVPG